MIRVYSTLTRTKEPFEPVQAGKVGMYLCGPTVYKPSHIGHMVGPVIFDCIKRFLVYSGYEVTWVVNITDVDDKLIIESSRRGIPMADLAAEMTTDYMSNLAAMGVDSIDHFPRATDNIEEIVGFIGALIEQGYAYASDGDVYFEVDKVRDYGKLSGRSLDSMQGEGGETAQRKRSSHDFALWKSAKPGEPSWPSPWGPGRPGWHIECSVMSSRILGATFDIHGGGLDLVFPHHENEIAQSEARHGSPMARYWLHNGLMQASDETGKVGGRSSRPSGELASQEAGKISKSKGASPFRELLQQYKPETIRFFLLATHYRRPIEYGELRLKETEAALENYYRFFKRYQRVTGNSFFSIPAATRRQQGEPTGPLAGLAAEVAAMRSRFLESMDDDFNTGGAIGDLFELLRRLNKFIDDEKMEDPERRSPAALTALQQGATTLRELAMVLGLFRQPPQENTAADDALASKLMELMIELRADARKTKNFALADKIRQSLAAIGVTLEDRPTGTEWTVAR